MNERRRYADRVTRVPNKWVEIEGSDGLRVAGPTEDAAREMLRQMRANRPVRVPLGTPISTDQAVRGLLRMLATPVIGDIEKESTGRAIERLSPEGTIYHCLSSGEKRLVDLARALWRAPMDEDPTLNALGGLDPDKRRKVLIMLMYRYLGRDSLVDVEFSESEFADVFGRR